MRLLIATFMAGFAAGTIAAAAGCLYDDDHSGWPFFFGVLPLFILCATVYVATIGSALHLLLRRLGVQSLAGHGFSGACAGLLVCALFSGSTVAAPIFCVALLASTGAIAESVYYAAMS